MLRPEEAVAEARARRDRRTGRWLDRSTVRWTARWPARRADRPRARRRTRSPAHLNAAHDERPGGGQQLAEAADVDIAARGDDADALPVADRDAPGHHRREG